MYTLLSNSNSVKSVEEHLDGNLCRCTGYRPIWDAARSLCDDGADLVKGPCGTACRECPERDACEQDCNEADKKAESSSGTEICCTSSADKMKTYKDTFLADQSWKEQPTEMFPRELLDAATSDTALLARPLMVVDRSEFHAAGTWFKPTTLVELLSLLQQFGGMGTGACKLVVGNTEVGIEAKFKHAVYPRLISPSDSIRELFGFGIDDTSVRIGACCPLSTIQHECEISGADPALTRTLMPMHDMLRWFASTQIRNVACLGGNLVTASPISDMNPMLASMGATLVLSSLDDKGEILRRKVKVADFFLRYRTVDLKPTEVVECVEVPRMAPVFEYLKPFKQARRREDDISIVTAGMQCKLGIQDGKFVIEEAALAFGGMVRAGQWLHCDSLAINESTKLMDIYFLQAPKTVLAAKTAEALVGSELSAETFEKAKEALLSEMTLPEGVPGGQAAYRMTLAASFLYKFYLCIVEDLKADIEKIKGDPSSFPGVPAALPEIPAVEESELTGTSNFLSAKKPNYFGQQAYPTPKTVVPGLEEVEIPMDGEKKEAPLAGAVGKSSTHQSGPFHCTGEAIYADDIPTPENTLQAALVLSSECGGVFESIDSSPALAIPGVAAVYTHKDLVALGGDNTMGPIAHDEVVFLPLGEKVRTVGQVLGIVVAETLEAAEHGARVVKAAFGKPTEKIAVTIEDAIELNSFYEFSRHKLERGDFSLMDQIKAMPDTTTKPKVGDVVKVSGTFHCGAQEHFYLETNSTVAIPSEGDLTIYASTQAPTKTQTYCASATNTPASKVVVRVKRMGGGFGGKETRSVFVSAAAAVAAKISSRPVRLTLSREVDMKTTGTRHAFVSEYVASAKVTETGAEIQSMDIQLYANGGWAFDLSGPVLDRAIFHSDGVYNIPNFRSKGVVCKTVQPAHTAYRGFGGPQGIAANEHIMEHLAYAAGVSLDGLRRSNMYKVNDHAPFGMIMGEVDSGKWNIPAMWDRLYSEMKVPERRKAIAEFNAANKWLKRGLALVPTKFGIAFTAKYMNQGGALVHLYTDGTVLVSHGGTEMGQGLHTKVCQVAAQAFGIPLSAVYVNDSSTDKVANTIPTAASMSCDMYGMATLNACRQILKRIQPVRDELGPDAPLKVVASQAFMSRIDMSAHGFFALNSSRCGFDWLAEKPDDFPVGEKPWNSWKGHPFNYFTQGVVMTEVEIDCLSGNHRTLHSDMIVDVGSSINPAIDIGQIEGAFTQGMGWSTIEESKSFS
jgi:xanthine dehydrogenase/oxidase